MINCCYRTKLWQKSLLIWNMLTFNNTSVNIKEEDGFFVPYESETISGKAKNCTITNFTGSKSLWWLKISESKTIWVWTTFSLITANEGRSSTVKGFVTASELRWPWSAKKKLYHWISKEKLFWSMKSILQKKSYTCTENLPSH